MFQLYASKRLPPQRGRAREVKKFVPDAITTLCPVRTKEATTDDYDPIVARTGGLTPGQRNAQEFAARAYEASAALRAATIESPGPSTSGPTLKDIRAGWAVVPRWKPEHSLLPPEQVASQLEDDEGLGRAAATYSYLRRWSSSRNESLVACFSIASFRLMKNCEMCARKSSSLPRSSPSGGVSSA